MKILLITSRFRPLVGGVEAVVETLAENLSLNHSVTVVTSLTLDQYIKSKYPNYDEFSKYKRLLLKILYGFLSIKSKDSDTENYEIYRFWINLPRSFLGYLAFPYRVVVSTISFINFVKKQNFDVINYHFPDDSAFYVYVMLFFVHKPLVLNIHGNDLHVFSYKQSYSHFISKLVKKADKIVVNSEYMRNDFNKRFNRYSRKVVIIPNGIDVEAFSKVEPRPYFSNDYIFFVGRMVHKKGVDVLLRAFAKANIENFSLFIEGRGEELDSILELADVLNIKGKVNFGLGKVDTESKNKYQKAAIFGVIPSRIEPFGIVALEMMATGTPIIASRTGGLATILKNRRNCLFFENENIDDLADKIKELYSDKELRTKMSENNIIDVKKYDHKEITKEYVNLFNKIIKNR